MHGLPHRITSDRGPQFAAELMKSLCAMLGTKQNLSTVYHPQTDSHVERSHQETEAFLRHYIDHLQDDWYNWLAIGEFQYNNKIHSLTNHTPFFLNYGHHPWKGEIQTSKGTNPTAEDFVHALEIAREEAAAAAMCYNMVQTPTLCKPDMSDRPHYFLFNLPNLATPLTTYVVCLVLLSLLPCYLYDAILILTSNILYSLIDTFLSVLRYISTHVFIVEP
jgi:hypothetical protein